MTMRWAPFGPLLSLTIAWKGYYIMPQYLSPARRRQRTLDRTGYALIGTTIIGFVMLFYSLNSGYDDAMASCQKVHSFDTCFHSLNR